MIAIASEPETKLRAYAMFKTQIKYKIFGKPRCANWDAYDNPHIPYVYLINADGTLAWEGNPGSLVDRKIDEALDKRAQYFMEKFSGAPLNALNAFVNKRLAEAYRIVQKTAQNDTQTGAKQLVSHIETAARRQMAYARELFMQQEYLESYVVCLNIKREWGDTDLGKQAAEKMKELKKDKEELQKELLASQQLENILQSYNNRSSKNKIKEGTELLRQFSASQKYSGTKAASKAEKLADVFEEAAK